MGGILNQGGEFGILLMASLASSKILPTSQALIIESSIVLSVFLAPLFAKIFEGHKVGLRQVVPDIDNVVSISEKRDQKVDQSKDLAA